MKKNYQYLALMICLSLFSCSYQMFENRVVGRWSLKSIIYQETLKDGSVQEQIYYEEEYSGPYFEFFSNNSYALFGIMEGKWHWLDGNRIHLEGGYEDGSIYTVVGITNTELILERDVKTNYGNNLKQIFNLYKME